MEGKIDTIQSFLHLGLKLIFPEKKKQILLYIYYYYAIEKLIIIFLISYSKINNKNSHEPIWCSNFQVVAMIKMNSKLFNRNSAF